MSKELVRFEIPLYIRTVTMSKARQKKYYVKGKKDVPKKYQGSKYIWKLKGPKECLYDTVNKEFIIANPRAHGTPKVKVINGQDIYNGEIQRWDRAKIMDAIKDNFQEYIDHLNPITEFPLNILVEVHDVIKDELLNGNAWDVDNRMFPYLKKFHDILSGNKRHGKPTTKQIIPDDDVMHITQPAHPKFIPIDNPSQRKLVFIIMKEDDPRIVEHKQYKDKWQS